MIDILCLSDTPMRVMLEAQWQLGIPDDHEIFENVHFIRSPADIKPEHYNMNWFICEPYMPSLHWYQDIRDPCIDILGTPMDFKKGMMMAILLLLSDYQAAIKRDKYEWKGLSDG